MYLRLGDTNIKYSTDQVDDFLIFSQVINSEMSYEKPVLVRTPDELEIWFGKNFTEKEYFDNLLEAGITLYLYRPVSDGENTASDDYIDTSSYVIDETVYESSDLLPDPGNTVTKYKVIDGSGSETDESTGMKFSYYIYLDGEYVKEDNLPQNLDDNNTESLNNRDTLCLNYSGYSGPEYFFPIYQENNDGELSEYPETLSEEDIDLLYSHLPDLSRVLLGYETLGFYLSVTDELDFTPSGDLGLDTKYIIVTYLDRSSDEYKRVLVWFEGEENILPVISSSYYDETREIEISGKSGEEILEEFLGVLKELGYTVEQEDTSKYKLYTPYYIPVTYFYNISGFSLDPSVEITHNILAQISSGNTRIRFTSKTIGTDTISGSDGNIGVTIKKLKGDDNYRITLSRFDYYEVYEGGLFTVGEERIDSKITRESSLCRCHVTTTYIDDSGVERTYKSSPGEGERDSSLPEGTWDLRRAESEKEYTRNMYWKAVNAMLGADDPVYVDFFLIPDIYKYTNGIDSDHYYYPEYETFLSLAENLGCQVLIENADTGWTYEEVEEEPEEPEEGVVYIVGDSKFMILENGSLVETIDPEITNIEGNNFVFNYTEDLDNRLLWFYRSFTLGEQERPGYYLFLRGIINDVYSISSSQVIYNTPTTLPYSTEDIEEQLEKYKSNYLVYNNQAYYYKKFQNGEDFNTSVWMRFCIGKVAREIQKHKWEILGQKSYGNLENSINQILNTISGYFSYIESLTLTELTTDYANNKVELQIESKMSDFADNDMTIDITLNYNKAEED